MTQKLFVRSSVSADEQAIFDYYRNNPDPNISQRAPEVWRERITSGAATIVHDAQDNIVACAIAYPVLKQTDQGPVHAWTEVGSVHAAWKNMGLGGRLIDSLVLRAWLLEQPDDRFILDIIVGNEHSKHAFAKAGATLYTDMPDDLKQKVKATLINQKNPLDWYQIGQEAMPGFARRVLEDIANPRKLRYPGTGEEYELDYSRSVLATQFKDVLEQVRDCDFGDVKKPDTQKPMSHHGRKFGRG